MNKEKRGVLFLLFILIGFCAFFYFDSYAAYITLQGFWIGGAASAFVLICEEIKHG